MHTFTGKFTGTVFNYNSDFSGFVMIKTKDKEIEVGGHDLLNFIAYCYVLPRRLARLEQADMDAILLR